MNIDSLQFHIIIFMWKINVSVIFYKPSFISLSRDVIKIYEVDFYRNIILNQLTKIRYSKFIHVNIVDFACNLFSRLS